MLYSEEDPFPRIYTPLPSTSLPSTSFLSPSGIDLHLRGSVHRDHGDGDVIHGIGATRVHRPDRELHLHRIAAAVHGRGVGGRKGVRIGERPLPLHHAPGDLQGLAIRIRGPGAELHRLPRPHGDIVPGVHPIGSRLRIAERGSPIEARAEVVAKDQLGADTGAQQELTPLEFRARTVVAVRITGVYEGANDEIPVRPAVHLLK